MNSSWIERQVHMKRKFWLWTFVALLLLASLPGLIHRWSVETKNHTYELVVPFEEIAALYERTDMDRTLHQLRQAGVSAISFQPLSLADLEKQQRISIFSKQQLIEALRFSRYDVNEQQLQDGYYIPVPQNRQDARWLQENLRTKKIQIAGNSFYFFHGHPAMTRTTRLGYDTAAIKMVQSIGMQPIFRMDNTAKTARVQQWIAQLSQMKQNAHTGILFSGEEVSGYPDLETIKTYTKKLAASGFHFYHIEFAGQKGMETVAKTTNYQVIRQHSLDLHTSTVDKSVEQAVRAIKERNIRSLFVHLPEAEHGMSEISRFASGVQQELPAKFTPGHPAPFAEIKVPLWTKAATIIASALFIFLILERMCSIPIRLIAAGLLLLIGITYFLTGYAALLKLFALLVAIITPICATISAGNGARSLAGISRQYAMAICITMIGVVIVTVLLNGNGFITGFALFRGVKLVYIVPILAVAFIVLKRYLFQRSESNSLIKFLHTPVTYWQLLLFALIAVIGLYYLSRTGNGGSVSGVELSIRQALEDLLYTRPRTKEVLIGFPAFITALYAIGNEKKWGRVLLIPASIGFLSMTNTFTHFHIPLSISVLREFYGALFGYFVGIIIIFICKWMETYWIKYQDVKSSKG